MREGHSVQGSKSEVTAQHHQELTFESPTQKGPSVTTRILINFLLSSRLPCYGRTRGTALTLTTSAWEARLTCMK